MKLFAVAALLLLALPNARSQQPPAPPKPQDWEVQIEFTAITLPEAFALPLLDALEDRATAPAAFEKIQAEIDAGRAMRSAVLRAKSEHGNHCTAEAAEEVRYPIEFEIPQFPNLNDPKSVAALPKDLPSVSMHATTFETRHAGPRLEAAIRVTEDGQFLRIEGKLAHTRFIRWDEFASGVMPGGTKIIVSQPRFFSAQSAGTFVSRTGDRLLAGIHKLPDQKGTLELFFLRAWTKPKPGHLPLEK